MLTVLPKGWEPTLPLNLIAGVLVTLDLSGNLSKALRLVVPHKILSVSRPSKIRRAERVSIVQVNPSGRDWSQISTKWR